LRRKFSCLPNILQVIQLHHRTLQTTPARNWEIARFECISDCGRQKTIISVCENNEVVSEGKNPELFEEFFSAYVIKKHSFSGVEND